MTTSGDSLAVQVESIFHKNSVGSDYQAPNLIVWIRESFQYDSCFAAFVKVVSDSTCPGDLPGKIVRRQIFHHRNICIVDLFK